MYSLTDAAMLQLGQVGSMFVDTADQDCTPPSGTVFIAITVIESAKFNDLVAEDTSKFIGDTGTDSGYSGGTGDYVTNSTIFSSGVTIYGRWTQFDIDSGSVIAYIGP